MKYLVVILDGNLKTEAKRSVASFAIQYKQYTEVEKKHLRKKLGLMKSFEYNSKYSKNISLNFNDLRNYVFKKIIPTKRAFQDKFNIYFLTNCRLLTT